MKLLVNAMRFDNLFLLSIFQLNDKKFISIILPLVSHSANGYYYPLIPALIFSLDPDKALFFLFAGLISFAIELPSCTVLKHVIKRNRPCEAMDQIHYRALPEDRFSLPSGHASASFVITVLLSHFYPLLILPSAIWAALVGVSRVYLGVHYPTDVIIGMAIGILSGVSGIAIAGCVL
jgi:undecaprenyl-diphosphatase